MYRYLILFGIASCATPTTYLGNYTVSYANKERLDRFVQSVYAAGPVGGQVILSNDLSSIYPNSNDLAYLAVQKEMLYICEVELARLEDGPTYSLLELDNLDVVQLKEVALSHKHYGPVGVRALQRLWNLAGGLSEDEMERLSSEHVRALNDHLEVTCRKGRYNAYWPSNAAAANQEDIQLIVRFARSQNDTLH